MKNGESFIKISDKQSKGTHWFSIIIDRNTAVYFDCFGIEYLPKDVLYKFIDKSMTHNIFRIQSGCGFYCIAFIEYMIAGKTLLDYTNLLFLNTHQKTDMANWNINFDFRLKR